MVNHEIDSILSMRLQVASDIRALAQHYFLPPKSNDPKDNTPEFARRLADGTGAVELVCSLVNVFGSLLGHRVYSAENAIADLTFSLNTNQFWVKNAANLMPIVSATVNAALDVPKLKLQSQPIWLDLEKHSKLMWLEILPAILLCLKGYSGMREQSLEIKQAFEKFLKVS
jgi:hypothetical protein